MRVLLIDDDKDTREALSLLLEGEGYDVATATDGREGLDELERGRIPGAVLLDMMMPVMSGWQFIEAVRKDPNLQSIPLIIVSAVGDQLLAMTGAKAIVRKPLNIDRLLRLLGEIAAASPVAHA